MNPAPSVQWTSDREFEVDGIRFSCRVGRDRFRPTADHFCIVKNPASVAKYVSLCERLKPQNILEIGMFTGGSTALLALLAGSARIVSFDLVDSPRRALGDFLERRGRTDSVVPILGVDQTDVLRVRQVVEENFAPGSVDLVIDDACHNLAATRTTFNTVFPYLRAGGRYVIEDWSSALQYYDPNPPEQAMARLILEATLAHASNPKAIAGLEINTFWVAVERGTAPLDPTTFDVRTLIADKGTECLSPDSGPTVGCD